MIGFSVASESLAEDSDDKINIINFVSAESAQSETLSQQKVTAKMFDKGILLRDWKK